MTEPTPCSQKRLGQFLNIQYPEVRPQSEISINGILEFYAKPPSPEPTRPRSDSSSNLKTRVGIRNAQLYSQLEVTTSRLQEDKGLEHLKLPSAVPAGYHASNEGCSTFNDLLPDARAFEDWIASNPSWPLTSDTALLSSQPSQHTSRYSATSGTSYCQDTCDNSPLIRPFVPPRSTSLSNSIQAGSPIVSAFESDDEDNVLSRRAAQACFLRSSNTKNQVSTTGKNSCYQSGQIKANQNQGSRLKGLFSVFRLFEIGRRSKRERRRCKLGARHVGVSEEFTLA